jgi:hypothetical protein
MSSDTIVTTLASYTGFSKADCHILMKAFMQTFKDEMIKSHAIRIHGLGTFKVLQSRKHGYYVRFYPDAEFKEKLFPSNVQQGDANETLFE